MCTVVDGGSIHRAARRISAASDQTSTTPMTSHRTKYREKPLRRGVLGDVSGFSVTFQNNNPAGWSLMTDLALASIFLPLLGHSSVQSTHAGGNHLRPISSKNEKTANSALVGVLRQKKSDPCCKSEQEESA